MFHKKITPRKQTRSNLRNPIDNFERNNNHKQRHRKTQQFRKDRSYFTVSIRGNYAIIFSPSPLIISVLKTPLRHPEKGCTRFAGNRYATKVRGPYLFCIKHYTISVGFVDFGGQTTVYSTVNLDMVRSERKLPVFIQSLL